MLDIVHIRHNAVRTGNRKLINETLLFGDRSQSARRLVVELENGVDGEVGAAPLL